MSTTFYRSSLLSLCLISLVSSTAAAGITNGWFALHREHKFSPTKTISRLCDDLSTPEIEPNYSPNFQEIPCYNYTTNAPSLAGSQVYLVVGNLGGQEGVAGGSFGIEYSGSEGIGIDPRYVTWTPCNDGMTQGMAGPHGNWPASKSGLRVTWNTCQTTFIQNGVHAVVGSFYVYAYSSDILRLTPNNAQSPPELALSNCNGVVTDFLALSSYWDQLLGSVGFGGSQGRPPGCSWGPAQTSTWGRLKGFYSARKAELKP